MELRQVSEIILASASPRRREILSTLGISLKIVPSTFPETLDKSQFADAAAYATATALAKGREVCGKTDMQNGTVVVSADTVVVSQDRILEKPTDEADAHDMLRALAGQCHQVITAVVMFMKQGTDIVHRSFHEITHVEFYPLSDAIIRSYVASGEPMDKAGGYGYQGAARFFVKKIDGCYWNVVGELTIYRFCISLDYIPSSLIFSSLGFPAARFFQELPAFMSSTEHQ